MYGVFSYSKDAIADQLLLLKGTDPFILHSNAAPIANASNTGMGELAAFVRYAEKMTGYTWPRALTC